MCHHVQVCTKSVETHAIEELESAKMDRLRILSTLECRVSMCFIWPPSPRLDVNHLAADESDAVRTVAFTPQSRNPDCSPSPAHNPTETAWYSYSALDSPMTCTRMHVSSTTWFPMDATPSRSNHQPVTTAHHDSKEFRIVLRLVALP